MKKLFLLAAPFFFVAQCACAATGQGATFTCASGLSVPITSFYFEINATNPTTGTSSQFITVTTDLTQFQALFVDIASGRVDDTCEVEGAPPSLKFLDVAPQLLSVTGQKGSEYVTATFSIGKTQDLQSNGAVSRKSAAALTPEQKNNALTQFLARAPKPSAN